MNVTHGMDVAEVEDLGRFLQQRADRLNRIVQEINRAVYAAHWNGGVAVQFGQQYWPGHRARLQAAANGLHGLGQATLHNAAEQRQASGAGGSGGASSQLPRLPGLGGLAVLLGPGFGALADGFGPDRSWGRSDARLEFWGREGRVEKSTALGAQGHAELSATARAGAELHGGASAKRSATEISATAAIGGSVGVGAAIGSSIGAGPLSASRQEDVFAGARADGRVTGRIGPDGATAGAHAEAFAGAEAEASGNVAVGGVSLGGGATVSAGIGGHVDANASVTMDRVALGLDVSGAIGIGGGVKASIEFSPAKTVEEIIKWNPFK